MIEKKYLKDTEEVIKALNEGKKVFDSTSSYMYKKVDGIICSYDTLNNNKVCDVNTFICMDHEHYIEEEQLNIEAGKFYRTRKGKKAYCFYKDETDKLYPNHFVVYGERGYETYTDDGLSFRDEENPEDIVGYWE